MVELHADLFYECVESELQAAVLLPPLDEILPEEVELIPVSQVEFV